MGTEELRAAVLAWFAGHERDLAWRRPGTSAWGVLVSEVMAQQTPVARVEPAWRAWMERWPTPADLAAAPDAEVLRAWDRLGYPRRALRLKACAAALVERHGGAVPDDEAALRALPGIGTYTAAAVRAFAHGRRSVVIDTNVARVLARVLGGEALPSPAPTRADVARAEALVPADDAAAARWNVAVMELGALVCTARAPRCEACPVATACRWAAAGRPAPATRPRAQSWAGSDRQVRGAIMARLRALPDGERLPAAALLADLPGSGEADQPARALAALVADGLVGEAPGPTYALPGTT